MKNSLMLFVAFLAFTACSKHEGKKNIAITGIDSTLRPGNDFFKYVNGKWYEEHENGLSEKAYKMISQQLTRPIIESMLSSLQNQNNNLIMVKNTLKTL